MSKALAFFWLWAMLSFGATASPEQSKESPTPEEIATRVFLCTPSQSRFRIVYPWDPQAATKSFATRQVINLPPVIWSSDPATDANARRTATESKTLECGSFSIVVQTGFFNTNPQGELGAADDFAEIVVTANGQKVALQMSTYWCPENISRARSFLPNNAVSIEGRHDQTARRHELKLTRSSCDADYKERLVEVVVAID